jgi:hypothetical protein
VFDAYLAAAMRNPRVVVGFADNRYSNGADVVLIRYMESQHSSASHIPMSKYVPPPPCPSPARSPVLVGRGSQRQDLQLDLARSVLPRRVPPPRHARFAYAGWNTDGNTLGTVISSSLLMALFPAKREVRCEVHPHLAFPSSAPPFPSRRTRLHW